MTEKEAGVLDRSLTHFASETLDTAARLPAYAEIRVLGPSTPMR